MEEVRVVETVESGIHALESTARAHPNGALIVGIEYARAAEGEVTTARHVLAAQQVPEKGLMFVDTDGKVYQGVAELARAYPNVALNPKAPILFMKNTWLVAAFKSPVLNVFFPAVFWGSRVGEQAAPKAFFGPPRRSPMVEGSPLGLA